MQGALELRVGPREVAERTYDGLRKAGMPEGEAKTN